MARRPGASSLHYRPIRQADRQIPRLGAPRPDLIDKMPWRANGERPMDLGIDIGTSAVKVVLVDEDDRLVDQESQPLTVSRPQPLWSEQDPEAWWRATAAAIAVLSGRQAKAMAA